MITILQGDCIEMMRTLPDESVQCIVTSPPYWGLRDYGIPPSIWGGDPDCPHEWVLHVKPAANGIQHDGGMSGETLSGHSATRKPQRSDFCQDCNAWRGVFGLEPTPDLYIAHLVSIMNEALRVLRNDGTLWLNLGDSYCASPRGNREGDFSTSSLTNPGRQDKLWGKHKYRSDQREPRIRATSGLKSGDLVGIPWRAAFALQAAGWFLRRDNIWFKPNPMPESVNGWRWEKHRIKTKPSARANPTSAHALSTNGVKPHGARDGVNFADHSNEYADCPGCEKCAPNGGLILRKGNWRCTTSHEYVFQFSKSASYFCDAEAAREVAQLSVTDKTRGGFGSLNGKHNTPDLARSNQPGRFAIKNGSRNRRSVWRIATKPFRGAHFATFPPDLVRPIILAASPVKACGECGAPYAPVIERGEPDLAHQQACGGDANGKYNGAATKDFSGAGAEDASTVKARILAGMVTKTVVGYRPTCVCFANLLFTDHHSRPPIILDMFGGSGTVGQVAQELGRDAILIELSCAYIPLIEMRCGIVKPVVAAA